MAKPSLEATRWATDGTNNTPPSSGQRDTGWTVGQDGVSDYDNAVKKAAYDWFKWLNEAQLNDGAVDYSLVADTADANLTGGDLTNIHTVYISSVGSEWELDGIANGTDKQEIQLINAGSNFFWLGHEQATSSAANRITIPSHIAGYYSYIRVYPGGSVKLRYHGASSRWRLVSMSGCKVRRCVTLPASLASAPTGSSHTFNGLSWRFDGTQVISFPLSAVMPSGSTLEGWRVSINKTSSSAVTVRTRINRLQSGAALPGAYTNNNENAPGVTAIPAVGELVYPDVDTGTSISETDISDTLPSKSYTIEVSTDTAGTSDNVYTVDAFIWVPA